MNFSSVKAKVAAVAAGVALLSLGGAASAASSGPAASPSAVTYHGCINDSTRTIRRVFVLRTPKCPADSFAATWDAQGPTGAAGPRGPAGTPATEGSLDLYDSTVPEGILNQTAGVLTEFGNAINLAPNPTRAALGTVNVGLVICSGGCSDTTNGLAASTASVTVTLYHLGVGGTVGSKIGTVTDSHVAVPSVPVGVTQVSFTAPFAFSSQHLVLPTSIVFGISVNTNPTGNLNLGLAPNVATGSDVYPGDIYVSTTAGEVSSLDSDIGTCTGNDVSSDPTTFQAVPVMCTSGYGGQNTEDSAGVLMNGHDGTYNGDVSENAGYQGTDQIPVVQFLTVS